MKAAQRGLLGVPLLLVCALAAGCFGPGPRPVEWGRGRAYLVGINYPWLHYGHDFGANAWGHDGVSAPDSRRTVEADFAYLQSQGVQVVRWFVFGDARAAPQFGPDGRATGLGDFFYRDFDAALALARLYDVRLIPVLFDFTLADKAVVEGGVQLGGRAALIADPAKRRALLDRALLPLLLRYGTEPHILAWDVINEPEGAMTIPGGGWVAEPVSAAAMQAFVGEVTGYVHRYAMQPVTVGSAWRRGLVYWRGLGLDFYQFHYYDERDGEHRLDLPAASADLDRPTIVGEFPTRKTRATVPQYLDAIWRAGYAGALPWGDSPADTPSNFRQVARDVGVWARAQASHLDLTPWREAR